MEDLLILFISFLLIMGIINIYKTKNSKVKYVKSTLYTDDTSEYLVRYSEGTIPSDPNNNCDAGANAICFMRANLMELVDRVRHERCQNDKCTVPTDKNDVKQKGLRDIKPKEIQMLLERFNPDNISESTHDDKYTSYSVNKGEKVIFCIREKNGSDKNKIIHANTLMFVAIHELAHIMTTSIGHGEDFWNNMRYLLSVAIETPAKKNYSNNTCAKKFKEQMGGSSHTIYYYEDYSLPDQSSKYCGTSITTTPCGDDETCKK
jgi:hypothetical protein